MKYLIQSTHVVAVQLPECAPLSCTSDSNYILVRFLLLFWKLERSNRDMCVCQRDLCQFHLFNMHSVHCTSKKRYQLVVDGLRQLQNMNHKSQQNPDTHQTHGMIHCCWWYDRGRRDCQCKLNEYFFHDDIIPAIKVKFLISSANIWAN